MINALMSKCYKIKLLNLFVCNNVIVSFQLLIIQTLFQNLGRVKEPTRSPPALRWTRGESSAGEFLTDYTYSSVCLYDGLMVCVENE